MGARALGVVGWHTSLSKASASACSDADDDMKHTASQDKAALNDHGSWQWSGFRGHIVGFKCGFSE